MLNSMTGFASLSGDCAEGRWDWEIRGVNARGLDLRVRLPEGFEALEAEIRNKAKHFIKRGSVTVVLRYYDHDTQGVAEMSSEGLSLALDWLREISDKANTRKIELGPVTAAEIAGLPGVISSSTERKRVMPREVNSQIPDLFDLFADMRHAEGTELGKILDAQLDDVEGLVTQSSQTAEAQQTRRGELLKERVSALIEASSEADPDRLQQELAILAVKADVTEEIDRLQAHVGAARSLVSSGGAVGRKLDFLMQEFNREANTLCSKSGSTELTQIGMDLKVLIDQMREQVQNLE